MSTLPSNRRLEAHYIIIQIAFWAMLAGILSYQVVLLTERGFTNTEIGIAMAVRSISAIVFQPVLGGWVDRHRQIPMKLVVVACLTISFVASAVYTFLPVGFWGTVVIFIILGWLEVSCYPFVDTMAVDCINAGAEIRYSLGRGMGSLGYAFSSLFLGFQISGMGVESTMKTHLVMVIVCIFAVITFPTVDAVVTQQGSDKPATSYSAVELLRSSPALMMMLLAVMFSTTGLYSVANFLPTIIEARGFGGTVMGISTFWGAMFELPAAFLFQHLLRKYSSDKVLTMALIGLGARTIALLLLPGITGIFVGQTMQIIGYGLFNPSSVYYIKDAVPNTDQVRGQALLMVAGNGFGGTLGSLVPGRILDLGGVNAMLLFTLVACCIGGALGYVAVKMQAKQTAQTTL